MSKTKNYLYPALYWEKNPGDTGTNSKIVICRLCPHNCILKEEQRGICRTRINHNGSLCTLAWNNPCSVCVDPIEKKPVYHFLPGTHTLSIAVAGCNMRCLNCQNYSVSQCSPDELQNHSLDADHIINKAIDYNTQSISFTYTEPTVYYEYMLEIAKKAHRQGIKTVMVSNGYINKDPLEKLCKWLDAANIDLKSFDPVVHLKLTGAKLGPVLETLKTLKKNGVWLEITHLIVPGYSDNPETFRRMCQWLVKEGFADSPLHISRFFPQHKLTDLNPTEINAVREACMTAEECGIKFIYPGNM